MEEGEDIIGFVQWFEQLSIDLLSLDMALEEDKFLMLLCKKSSKGNREVQCYRCKKLGHLRRDCLERKEKGERGAFFLFAKSRQAERGQQEASRRGQSERERERASGWQ